MTHSTLHYAVELITISIKKFLAESGSQVPATTTTLENIAARIAQVSPNPNNQISVILDCIRMRRDKMT